MTYDLTKFDLGDMLKCSLRLRETLSGAPCLEASAHRTCRFLYDELHGPDAPHACALVRCYKTHPFGSLEPELQSFARGMLGSETPRGIHGISRAATAQFRFQARKSWRKRP
jgi:hypothetical protein